MKVTVYQKDIETALKMYFTSQGISLANKTFNVDFAMKRKPHNLTATVSIEDVDQIAKDEPIINASPAVLTLATPIAEEQIIDGPVKEVAPEPVAETVNTTVVEVTVTDELVINAAPEPEPAPEPLFAPEPEPVVQEQKPIVKTPLSLFA
jgi:hypothetical protein